MKDNSKFLDKIESEAWDVIASFKKNPIKSIIIACVVIWFVKKIVRFIRED